MKISAVILIYPFPWFNERLKHKDVFLFPSSIAKALGVPLLTEVNGITTGEEREGQSAWMLRFALLLNCLIELANLFKLRFSKSTKTPCFIFFHIGWPTALLASLTRLLWAKHARIIIKTDLNATGSIASYGGSFFERISIKVLRHVADILTAETLTTTQILRRIFDSPVKIFLCRNGIDVSSLPLVVPSKRETDILIVSRFLVKQKGALLYSEILPKLIKTGLCIHLIGEGAQVFSDSNSLEEFGEIKISENLSHKEVLMAMQHSRIFLNLSISESFVIAVVEAYALGCRIIATPVGVAPDLAQETPNVTIVPFDVENIIKIVIKASHLEQPAPPVRLGSWEEVIESSGIIQDVCHS